MLHLLWRGDAKRGLEISKSPVYNQEKEGTQMQDLMPSVKIISKIEIASLTLDGFFLNFGYIDAVKNWHLVF